MADQRQAGSLWTPEEDVVLLRHVAKYGTKHWGYLQSTGVLPHRDQKACCNRFILLKRKFFQARAKGQRLTFPAVPQSEAATSLRRTLSPSSLKASPHSTFKKPSYSGPAALKLPDSSSLSKLQERCQSADVRKAMETSSSGGQVDQGQLEMIVERFPSAGLDTLPPAPLLARAQPASSPMYALESEVMPPLVDVSLPVRAPAMAPVTATASLPAPAPQSQSSAFHLAPPQAGLSHSRAPPSSAAWRCFNAGTLEPGSVHLPSNELARSLEPALNAMGQSTSTSHDFSPDALLDQIATTPLQMLFGSRPAGTSSSIAATPTSSAGVHPSGDLLVQAADAASLWESPNSCTDLWDLMRSAASV